MTEFDVARNAKALRNLAARLEHLGYTGDSYAEAEHIARRLIADGWRPVEPVPPLRPDRAELDGAGYREFVEAKNRLKEKR